MQFKIQLTIVNPESGVEITEEITLLDKPNHQIEDIGLTLSESKSILKSLQEIIVAKQVKDYVETHRPCPDCGKTCRKKGDYPPRLPRPTANPKMLINVNTFCRIIVRKAVRK